MSGPFEDDHEAYAADDPPIDWDRVEEVAKAINELEPLEALTALYGDDLKVL